VNDGSVIERVVIVHAPDETTLAVECASAIAAATGVGVGLARESDRRVRWYLFRPKGPLE
jgi:hypothetical protein